MIPTTHKREITIGSRTISIETGKLAKQADGAVSVQLGETIVIVAAVAIPAYQEYAVRAQQYELSQQ